MKKWGGILLIVLGICAALYCVWEIKDVSNQNKSETINYEEKEPEQKNRIKKRKREKAAVMMN